MNVITMELLLFLVLYIYMQATSLEYLFLILHFEVEDSTPGPFFRLFTYRYDEATPPWCPFSYPSRP